ncbi:response regulator transcription factor [Acidovorax sp. SDU_ACID1]|uniref:response regulator transcription factor n=1 Tax=Acidovorax sp. SDU_ACID1 TaxID=3136632 RepID=UPI0038738C11
MTHRVLLVEDNSTIRATLIPALEELADMEVVATADDVASALQAISAVAWDVVVLDLFLKKGTGLDVLKNMTALDFSAGKVLVLTNYATADIRQRCLRLGADAVFDKSTEIEGFLEVCAAM